MWSARPHQQLAATEMTPLITFFNTRSLVRLPVRKTNFNSAPHIRFQEEKLVCSLAHRVSYEAATIHPLSLPFALLNSARAPSRLPRTEAHYTHLPKLYALFLPFKKVVFHGMDSATYIPRVFLVCLFFFWFLSFFFGGQVFTRYLRFLNIRRSWRVAPPSEAEAVHIWWHHVEEVVKQYTFVPSRMKGLKLYTFVPTSISF